MRTGSILESLALFVATTSAANVVEIGINRIRPGQEGLANTLRSRASSPSTFIETLVNNVTGGGYYASVNVGTPPQPQVLVIDTGSSDVWVIASDADLCTSSTLQHKYRDTCSHTYDSSKSSTYKLVNSEGFDITYLDGTGSSGDYIADTFEIGGASIKALQMGLASQTIRGTGIMGISYSASESTLDTYPNLIDQFQEQGLIATKAYSLYLNDFRSDSGSILFGGVDKDKFIGNLTTMPILQTKSSNGTAGHSVLAVALNSMTADPGTGKNKNPVSFPSGQPLPAILDSGTTLSYLPSSVASSLFNAIGAYTDDVVTGYTFIDCDGPDSLSLTFQLGQAATIELPKAQIVLDVFQGMQSQIPSNVPFSNACLFGFQDIGTASSSSLSVIAANNIAATSGSSYALLGDTFLRSSYVVYDLTNNEVGLAQANLNSTSSNVVELQASDVGIPTLTGVTAQQTTSTSSSGGSGGGGSGGGSGTTSGSDGGGTVTVTASPGSNVAAGRVSGPSYGVLAAAGAACLASFLGGAMVMA
ncbi:uncharacterized protein SPSK_03287 [Sporothrix schenckii 1099-18]|uniref:Peptidase A1 domain-containing protein n=2 Tax=Sporothrix schenckii TaxID=29908 RepID=U7PV79_SPOS1|nr:uncharacterized protein SPSK_03287 [Sporothrix schenckii 1099-18]ERS99543.1 hypothetical protein HMPREF1624_04748 [Sporothrix schenckii ATCC 58251]KJR82712.1 hypothetical protein SPSK_03287 [Sporothrix schenckii 1099-18]